jgi:hypothetical protein
VALLGLAGAWSAWTARPPQVVLSPAVSDPWPASPAAGGASSGPTVITPAPALASAPTSAPRAAPASKIAAAAAPERRPTDGGSASVTSQTAPQVSSAAAWPADAPMRPDFSGKIFAIADRSAVAPGNAVRVTASMTDPDGVKLITDLTAFGSQSRYRDGFIVRNGSRFSLFTSVVQQGDRLLVAASLDRNFRPATSGVTVVAPGEAGDVVLPNGQVVKVVATVRPETPDEIDAGRKTERKDARKFEARWPEPGLRPVRPIWF